MGTSSGTDLRIATTLERILRVLEEILERDKKKEKAVKDAMGELG